MCIPVLIWSNQYLAECQGSRADAVAPLKYLLSKIPHARSKLWMILHQVNEDHAVPKDETHEVDILGSVSIP